MPAKIKRKATNGKVSKAHTPMSGEVGRTGLRISAGRVNEEFLPQLKNSQKWKVYDEMLNNEPLIGTMDFSLRKLISQVKWSVEAASEDAVDVDAAKFVESCLHDMEDSWPNTLDEILSFPAFGFSLHEVVLKQRLGPDADVSSEFDDGRIGWKKLPIRAQETITWVQDGPNGEIIGIEQRLPQGQAGIITIPMSKMLHFRNYPHKGNPEGRSIFRPAYIPWYYKKKLQGTEAIGLERELNGLPLVRIPGELLHVNANADQKAAAESYKSLVRDIKVDEQAGIVIPSDRDKDGNLRYDFELLSTNGRRAIDIEKVIHRYSVEILMVILADFILLGHERIGTQSLSSSKTSLFALALNSFMQEIISVFNKKAIPMLMSLNTFKTKKNPKLTHGDIETEDIVSLAMGMQHLANAGFMVTSPETQNEVWRRTNMPQQEREDIETHIAQNNAERMNSDIVGTSNPKGSTPVANKPGG